MGAGHNTDNRLVSYLDAPRKNLVNFRDCDSI